MQPSKLKRFIEILVFLEKNKGKATSEQIRNKFKMTYAQVNKLFKKWEAPEQYFKNLDPNIDVKIVNITHIPENKQLLAGPKVFYGLADLKVIFLKDLAKILADYSGSIKNTQRDQENKKIKEQADDILNAFRDELPNILEEAGYTLQDRRGLILSDLLQKRLLKLLNKT